MLTKVDHWLRERYLLQTHIYTMRLPDKRPAGVKVIELPNTASARYLFRIICNTNQQADKLIEILNDKGMMFATQVVERSIWYKPIIAPKGGSVILTVFWLISFCGLTLGLLKVGWNMKNNEELMDNLKGAVAVFQGSEG